MEAKPSLIKSIIITGLIAGTMDIIAACTQAYLKRGTTPDVVFKYIASALFGPDAFTAGTSMAAAGLLFHYVVAFGWTILFFLLYPRLNFLRGNRLLVGAIYAVFIQAMMRFVVVPLTMINQGPFDLGNFSMAASILIVCIGIPIAIGANRHYSQVKY